MDVFVIIFRTTRCVSAVERLTLRKPHFLLTWNHSIDTRSLLWDNFISSFCREKRLKKERMEATYREGLTLTPPVRFFFGAAEALAASPLSSGTARSPTSDERDERRLQERMDLGSESWKPKKGQRKMRNWLTVV